MWAGGSYRKGDRKPDDHVCGGRRVGDRTGESVWREGRPGNLYDLDSRHANAVVPLHRRDIIGTIDALGASNRDGAVTRRRNTIELHIVAVRIYAQNICRSNEGPIEEVGLRDLIYGAAQGHRHEGAGAILAGIDNHIVSGCGHEVGDCERYCREVGRYAIRIGVGLEDALHQLVIRRHRGTIAVPTVTSIVKKSDGSKATGAIDQTRCFTFERAIVRKVVPMDLGDDTGRIRGSQRLIGSSSDKVCANRGGGGTGKSSSNEEHGCE